jgi:glycerol kinase
MTLRKKAVLAVDLGTTSIRAILYGRTGRLLATAYREFRQYYPKPGWVEHDPEEIWDASLRVIRQSMACAGMCSEDLACIGIANQRETVVLWNKQTGKPVCRALVWQDRRTSGDCFQLKKKGLEKEFRSKTGLVLDPYFSGTKVRWLLRHIPGLQKKAGRGNILFGTMDTWFLWKLTGGAAHATDFTNASRTLFFNIKTKKWDSRLLRLLGVPEKMLPRVLPSGGLFGRTSGAGSLPRDIPITAIMGDQQAALYGQACYRKGEAKNTYGTGCFVVVNAGATYRKPPHGLLATLACDERGRPVYALEGSIFIAGAAVQWLRDGLQFFRRARETNVIATRVRNTGGVVMIPAFVGLGAPHWNPDVRGVISGLTRGTRREHIVRAALESIAHQTADVVECIERSSPFTVRHLKADGGATGNRFLMQTQADLLQRPVFISDAKEATAWGAAKLAAKTAGFWPSLSAVDRQRHYKKFIPKIPKTAASAARGRWRTEICRLLDGISR